MVRLLSSYTPAEQRLVLALIKLQQAPKASAAIVRPNETSSGPARPKSVGKPEGKEQADGRSLIHLCAANDFVR